MAGPYQFTHTAAHQAWYATVNALFGRFRSFRADYRVIPWSTFVDPEVARVGINEQEARRTQDRVRGDGHSSFWPNSTARSPTAKTTGFVKVLTRPGTDRILGVTIVGPHAGDLLAEYVLCDEAEHRVESHPGDDPHLPDAGRGCNRAAAGQWRRSQVTLGQWAVLEAVQGWMRGARGLGAVVAALGALLRDRRKAYTVQAE